MPVSSKRCKLCIVLHYLIVTSSTYPTGYATQGLKLVLPTLEEQSVLSETWEEYEAQKFFFAQSFENLWCDFFLKSFFLKIRISKFFSSTKVKKLDLLNWKYLLQLRPNLWVDRDYLSQVPKLKLIERVCASATLDLRRNQYLWDCWEFMSQLFHCSQNFRWTYLLLFINLKLPF